MTHTVQLVLRFNTFINFGCGADERGAQKLFHEIEDERKRRTGISIFSSPDGNVTASVKNSDIAAVILVSKETSSA